MESESVGTEIKIEERSSRRRHSGSSRGSTADLGRGRRGFGFQLAWRRVEESGDGTVVGIREMEGEGEEIGIDGGRRERKEEREVEVEGEGVCMQRRRREEKGRGTKMHAR